ncbi:hypothetical protein H2201_009016 [Coniosporium apollinis]|uniref:FCP1 homology domain-containing protein n=2 Tax=Coniosporium TaxID=2810619 RepID=A0ABQ9NHG8_9PEZI|nr:hypothetical protein H2201_009016 [Coniosporium apollinis]
MSLEAAQPPGDQTGRPPTADKGIADISSTSATQPGSACGPSVGPTSDHLNIPQSSTSASNDPAPAGTGLSGATVSGRSDSIGRGSRRSLTGKRRAGSTTSSKRSQQVPPATSEKGLGSAPAAGPSTATTQTKPKKKRVSRFLAFLNCCGVPEHGNLAGQEDTPEASRTARIQPTRNTQPGPSKKQDVSAAESSTADSKEPVDEKSSEPVYQNTGAISEKKAAQTSSQGDATMDRQTAEVPTAVTVTAPTGYSDEKRPYDQPLPPLPNQPGRLDTTSAVLPPQVTVQAPTPVMTPAEEQVISDRTPQQAQTDTDIEMTDSGPSLPLAASEVPAVTDTTSGDAAQREAGPPKVDLPPPPPLAERQVQTGTAVVATTPWTQDTSVAVTPPETQKWLLPPIRPEFKGKKCLVLDLDETLVHSSFKILHQADFTIPVEIEGQYHNVYVIKRPGVDAFMKRVGELYEVVVFTASVSKYGDPLLDQLDIHGVVHHRLFRESCYNHQGNYVKDLSQVGRDLRETIIIDNSPTSYIFHPQHAVPISSWFSDAHDNELLDLIPVLEDLAGPQVSDVSLVLDVGL